jgi:DNA-binding protein H-NS
MEDSIKQLPLDELKTLHREIEALIAEKRHAKLEAIRHEIATHGFTAAELAPPKAQAADKGAPKYRNAETGETWGGRGHRPQWLKTALDNGRTLEEFAG